MSYSDAKVANRSIRVWHGRQKMVPERWTNPKLSRRTCSCEYGLRSWVGKSVGVAKRPRELSPPPRNPTRIDSQAVASLYTVGLSPAAPPPQSHTLRFASCCIAVHGGALTCAAAAAGTRRSTARAPAAATRALSSELSSSVAVVVVARGGSSVTTSGMSPCRPLLRCRPERERDRDDEGRGCVGVREA
jgi:hypothetical protein